MTLNSYIIQPLLQKTILACLALFIVLGCKQYEKQQNKEIIKGIPQNIQYATGFSVLNYPTHKVLQITKPWQNADKTFKYLLISDDSKEVENTDNYDAIIKTPVQKIVVTSTTHIPALELLGVEDKLAGFPETKYISSKKIRTRIDKNLVSELGKNEGINTEVLLELNPDLVVGFGVDGNNKTFENIKKADIPVIYNGDWMETSPLGKAEWIKFFGVLFNKQKQADSIFNQIKTDYQKAKTIAKQAKTQPTVLSGAMYKDVWYLPNGKSTEAQILKDANVNYLWKNTEGSGSLALSFEAVFDKAQNADIWLNPSNFSSYDGLEKANPHYLKFQAFKNKTIFTINNMKGETGGVIYYELGTTRPDWVLMDIIKICHPDLLDTYQPHFFKPLN